MQTIINYCQGNVFKENKKETFILMQILQIVLVRVLLLQ